MVEGVNVEIQYGAVVSRCVISCDVVAVLEQASLAVQWRTTE